MKTKFNLLVVLVLLFLLTACGQSQSLATEQAATEQATAPTTLSLSTMLYGVLALEDAGTPVTADQAKSLEFYWKGVKALYASDNVAPEEMTGLTEQIQDVFTADQKSFVENMEFTPQTSQTLFKYLSIDQTAAQTNGSNSNNGQGSVFNNGGDSQGGPTDGGNFSPPSGSQRTFNNSGGEDFGGLNAQRNGTNSQGSTGQTQMANMRLPDAVIDAFIAFLQEKAAS